MSGVIFHATDHSVVLIGWQRHSTCDSTKCRISFQLNLVLGFWQATLEPLFFINKIYLIHNFNIFSVNDVWNVRRRPNPPIISDYLAIFFIISKKSFISSAQLTLPKFPSSGNISSFTMLTCRITDLFTCGSTDLFTRGNTEDNKTSCIDIKSLENFSLQWTWGYGQGLPEKAYSRKSWYSPRSTALFKVWHLKEQLKYIKYHIKN